jgi:predicted transposase YdaD
MKPPKMGKKLGTDEAFLQLMAVSGNSLLKLFGMSAQEANQYQFRAVVLKEKKLQPDVEGFPLLESDTGRVFIEFQGYKDQFIRYRTVGEVFWACAQEGYTGKVVAGIIYTDKKYQEAALSLDIFRGTEPCQWKGCIQEIVLTEYTQDQLVQIDPKLIVLAPFTVPTNTPKAKLVAKGLQWQRQIKQIFPSRQQPTALNVLGLFILGRFLQLNYQEVRTMLNLDLTKSLAVKQLQKMARDEGVAEGLAKGQAKGRLENAQETVLKALDKRFGTVPKPLSNQIRRIKQPPVLETLLWQVLRSQDLKTFKMALTQVK